MLISSGGLQSFFFFLVFHRIWTMSFCSVLFTGDWEERERERAKNIRGKGWKSFWTCTLMGEQISSKLAASRQEFDTALDNSQTGDAMWGDEERDKRVRRMGRWMRGERGERIKSRTCYIYITSYLFLNVYLAPHFSLSKFFAFPPSSVSPLAVFLHVQCFKSVPGATLLRYSTEWNSTVAACDV